MQEIVLLGHNIRGQNSYFYMSPIDLSILLGGFYGI